MASHLSGKPWAFKTAPGRGETAVQTFMEDAGGSRVVPASEKKGRVLVECAVRP